MSNLTPNPLFILEIANNHMGKVEHGLRIIREFAAVSKAFPFNFGFKLQYRHLDTFIHPEYQGRSDVKYVKRFSETRLEEEQFLSLKQEMQKWGFITICTPFDEKSVDLIEEHKFDIVKIGSCSFTDWPLLERIVESDKPVIASAAGIGLDDIDKVVSFFEHRNKEFALMHCVAEYPTPLCNLQLNQIDLFRSRYPHVRIGYSTHEPPDLVDAVKIAIAKGASIFEKHVGVASNAIQLNAYSATPEQVRRWLEAAQQAFTICGLAGRRAESSPEEQASLRSLRRGVFAKKTVAVGERIDSANTFLAIPTVNGQLTANDLSKYNDFFPLTKISINAPVMYSDVRYVNNRERIYEIVKRIREMFKKSGVAVPRKADLEISHHHGLERFDEVGITMITVVNRQYCKKLIIMLPGQQHPEQYHQLKEETFHILYGDVLVDLDGDQKMYKTGDVITVERGVKHSFSTPTGVIIEEISSTHHVADSYYTDPSIAQNKYRKTLVTYWLE
jgi:sialic acid synthase SpsE/quercetin dioxygenase-like cupin family protein